MTDFSKTLIRCHALGNIMTEPRSKASRESGELSETCKTHLIQTYALEKYGRIREIQTKQVIKGTTSEDDSITLVSLIDGKLYSKNTERINNEFISGTPDLYDTDDIYSCNEIIDVKTCWDIFTFLSNVPDPENQQYYWQLQGYMALTGAQVGTIAYCLVNTPDSIIEGEKYVLLKRMDVATEEHPSYQKELKKLLHNRYFDDISVTDRILTFSIDRNDDDIQKIYDKVVKCRKFLSQFEDMHLNFCKTHRKRVSNHLS